METQPTATTADLRKNFQEQLEKVTTRINNLAGELEQAREFRTKLLGGLETLQILDPVEEEEVSEESASAE
jgi:hypothetical protein